MSRSIASRRSVFTGIAAFTLSGLMLMGGAGAATAATVENTGSVRAITTVEQAATERYTGDLAGDILAGNSALGNQAPTAPWGTDVSNPEVVNLTAAHKAKAYKLAGISAERISSSSVQPDLLYAPINYQNGLVIENKTGKWLVHTSPITGGKYYLAPEAGYLEWIPKGGIGSKWKANGGANVVGLPTGPESKTLVAGTHAGATSYVVQQYATSTGALSDIYWSSKGTYQVKGAIRTNYLNAGGARNQGVPISNEIKNADGSVTQKFERISITWYPGGKIVRK